MATSLRQRKLDLLFFVFLLIHIPATLLVDSQALFFAERVSHPLLRQIFAFAAKDDPLLSNALNLPAFAWFQAFICLEILFQLPIFFIGAVGLWKGSRSVWPLLAIYGASSATTTLACIATVLTMPGIEAQLPQLLGSYVPFLLVPAAMAGVFGTRLTRLAVVSEVRTKTE